MSATNITVRISGFVIKTSGQTVGIDRNFKMSKNASEISVIFWVFLRARRRKRINRSDKTIEFYLREGRSADTVVNVTTIEFRFRAVVLAEKFGLTETFEKLSVAGSHSRAHGYTVGLFAESIIECKTVESSAT